MNHFIRRDASRQVSWLMLCRMETRLGYLEDYAKRSGSRDWREWSTIKSSLETLVGWFARDPRLRTEEAYQTAYDHLLAVWEGR